MKFLVRYGSDLRILTVWHCEDGNIYVDNGRFVDKASVSNLGTVLELESALREYCKEYGYEFIGGLFREA